METPIAERTTGRESGRRLPRRIPLSLRSYQTLRTMLMEGGFRPGEGVSLRSLARRLDTSTMPVREAVNRLIAERALQMLPNRQVIVPRMSRNRFKELCEVRQALESMATESALKNLTDDDIDAIDSLNAAVSGATFAKDSNAILRANKEFHFAIYEASQSDVLIPMIEGIWMQMGPFMHISLAANIGRWDGSGHRGIVRALKNRDPEDAPAAIRRDISTSARIVYEMNLFDD